MTAEKIEGWHTKTTYTRRLDEKHMLTVDSYFDEVLHRWCWSLQIYLDGKEAVRLGRIGNEGMWREGMIHGGGTLEQELADMLIHAREEVLPRAIETDRKRASRPRGDR